MDGALKLYEKSKDTRNSHPISSQLIVPKFGG